MGDGVGDILSSDAETGPDTGETASISVLVADTANRNLVREELADRGTDWTVLSGRLDDDCDLCLLDEDALRENAAELRDRKTGRGSSSAPLVSRSGGTITFDENSPAGNVVGVELPR